MCAAQVIEELIDLAKLGEALNLTEDEIAFYDVLETNDSAVKVLGDDTLQTIARELVATVHSNVTIDWTVREECPRTDACACKEYSTSAGQAGEGYSDCADASGSVVTGMGCGGLTVFVFLWHMMRGSAVEVVNEALEEYH